MVAALWSCPVQAAVRTSLIVKADPSANASAGLRPRLVRVQVHVFIFKRAPEAFDKHIVQPTAPAVHGDADSIVPQDVCKGKAGKLAALIRVEDVWCAVFFQGFFQGHNAKIRLHSV